MLYLPPDPVAGQPVSARIVTAILRYVRQITPRSSAHCRVQIGPGGSTFDPIFPNIPPATPPSVTPLQAWPFECYGVVQEGECFVRVNSGDGQVGTINGVVATIDGIPISTPPFRDIPPLLPVGDGDQIYITCTLDDNQNVITVEVDAGSMPDPDTANPPTYVCAQIGQVTISEDPTTGKPILSVDNTTDTGFSQLAWCGATALFV
jgi:hypothetical protein